MQFIVIASLIASVLAVPADMAPRSGVCQDGTLYTNPQCCTPNVLNVACLDGGVRKSCPPGSSPSVTSQQSCQRLTFAASDSL